MNIDLFIEKEAPNANSGSTHDQNYAAALRRSFNTFKDFNLEHLKKEQAIARNDYARFGPTHSAAADCVILCELIKEKEAEHGDQ